MEDDALIGQRLGAYLVQSKLGEGGMARVYKAYHARLRREVAIKVILSQIAEQADFKVRFEREAQLVASLQHPNIVAVYDFGDYEAMTYLVMQYVGGGTLRDRLRGGRALDPRAATLYTIQMGKALHHAHLRGIVHRDVKPQNMLVSASDQGQLLLSDFGIAKLYSARQEPAMLGISEITAISDPSLTSVDQIVGTAEYMAPEQVHGHAVDARTDVYALGVVLFQMLTGEVPFHSTTVQGLLYQHVYTPPRNVQEFNPNVSETLARIVAKAMAKSPADRFQSAEEMAQALEAANSNATYRLTNSMPPVPPTFQTSYNQQPGIDPLTLPSQQRPSLYGQPSQAGVPAPGAASAYGQYGQATGVTPPYGAGGRVTSPGATSGVIPSTARSPRRMQPLSYVGIGLAILLALGLILAKTGYLPFFSGGTGTPSTTAQSFTETFHDNHLSWTIGSVNGLNASLGQNSYILDIPLSSTANTYFPYPTSAGSLLATFTWSAQMEQTKGAYAFYGLAFNLKQGSTGVSCYAFIINGQGNYQVLKYSAGSASPATLAQGQSTAIHTGLNQVNLIQVHVQANTFTLTINHTTISTSSPIVDNTGGTLYTGGEPALLVAGSSQSEVSYTVTQAQLTMV